MEHGEGDEEHGEDVESGLGRGIEVRDKGLVPDEGGVEHGGGEEEPEGGMAMGLGRDIWARMGVGDEGVGAGEGVEEESGVCCFEEEEEDRVAAEAI